MAPSYFYTHLRETREVSVCVSACAGESEWGRGQKQPLLCLQEQGLAAEEREEKRGEDCVWNCPSVAVVALSHFISATAALFPPIYLPSDYSSPPLTAGKTLALSVWMAQHNR